MADILSTTLALKSSAPLLVCEVPLWVYSWLPISVICLFFFMFGASVGSFLNVVIYRLPEGRSIVRPGSSCPRCGWMLPWHENLPILGWLRLRGRCSSCSCSISIQYVLVELFVGILFAGLYLLFFVTPLKSSMGSVSGEWWHYAGLPGAWPAFAVLLTVFSGLLAATIIDARTFLIPGPITAAMILIGLVAWCIQGILPSRPVLDGLWPIPMVSVPIVGISLGATAGAMVGVLGLKTGAIPRSFMDYEDYVDEGETLGDYPHGRREMFKEMLFLLPIFIGAVAGWFVITRFFAPDVDVPVWWLAISSSLFGGLVGGGVVWLVRILGTLGFGREAMGMGDVHLLVAVGVCLGWEDPLRAFFIAPFTALAWIGLTRIVSLLSHKTARELPYGPHLAIATILIILFRPWVDEFQSVLFLPPPIH